MAPITPYCAGDPAILALRRRSEGLGRMSSWGRRKWFRGGAGEWLVPQGLTTTNGRPSGDNASALKAQDHAATQIRQTTPGQEDRPPASDFANAEGAAPTQAEFQADEDDRFTPPSQSQHPPTGTQDQEAGHKTPTPPRENNPQTSSSANPHDEGFTWEMERADLRARQVKSLAQPRHTSAAMFTNAQNNKISGCTFHNVAHIHESNAPAPVGISVLQFAGLTSLQMTYTGTLQYYLHFYHPQVAPPVMAFPSTVSVSLHLPSHFHEMKTTVGSLALLLWFIKRLWTQQRTIRHL